MEPAGGITGLLGCCANAIAVLATSRRATTTERGNKFIASSNKGWICLKDQTGEPKSDLFANYSQDCSVFDEDWSRRRSGSRNVLPVPVIMPLRNPEYNR